MVQYKLCTKCKIMKPPSEFYSRRSDCKYCFIEQRSNTYKKIGSCLWNSKSKISRAKLRLEVLTKYGRICAVCGEGDASCLQVDHINGGGNKHRIETTGDAKGAGFYNWLRKNKYPTGFQVLCANCNFSKNALKVDIPVHRKVPVARIYSLSEYSNLCS